MKRSLVILGLVLCLIALWLLWATSQPNKPVVVTTSKAPSKATVEPTNEHQVEKPSKARKPLTISSKGKVRLKPGESAVLGYWEIAPGMNGMAIVTPETTPEGYVKMTTKLLQMPDAVVSDADAHDLFPALFEFENFSAINAERLAALQNKLQSMNGIDLLAMPSLLTKPGQRAVISVGNAGDSKLSLDLQPDPINGEDGFDLNLGLDRRE